MIVLRLQFIVLIKNLVQLLLFFLQLLLLILDFSNQALLAIVIDFAGPCFFQVAYSAELHDGRTLFDQVRAHCNMAHDFIWPATAKHTIHVELQMRQFVRFRILVLIRLLTLRAFEITSVERVQHKPVHLYFLPRCTALWTDWVNLLFFLLLIPLFNTRGTV